MEGTSYFTSDFFGFLKDLAKNNSREWFAENKPRYQASVQEPCLRFILDAGVRLRSLSPYLVADPRPFGGSLSRIYRDIRFSPDKSPYKTNVAIHFWHEKAGGPGHMSPGLYVHLAPGGSFAGGGVWRPDAPTLTEIRDRIVAQPDEWRTILKGKAKIEGESVKRTPPGYDPNHPFVFDLRRKDFVVMVPFADREVTSPHFLDGFVGAAKEVDPLNGFLARAIGVPW